MSNSKKGELLILGALLLIIGIIFFGSALFSDHEGTMPVQGTPVKNSATGLYPVNVIVMGHRDWTILHTNLHANIRIDFVSFYFQGYQTPPSGITLAGFDKLVHIAVSVSGNSISSTLENTFDRSVSLGATWGQVLTYNLPPGSYLITAQGIDQDGFVSSASANLILP